eukprot:861519-Pelagomonas_calceolata.AAC.1
MPLTGLQIIGCNASACAHDGQTKIAMLPTGLLMEGCNASMMGCDISLIQTSACAYDGHIKISMLLTGLRMVECDVSLTQTSACAYAHPHGYNSISMLLTGLLMVGCDASVIQGYFIPSLGPAPKWCSHLEGLTEEMEEAAPSVYDDYRWDPSV